MAMPKIAIAPITGPRIQTALGETMRTRAVIIIAAVATLRDIPTNGLSVAIGFFTRTILSGDAFFTVPLRTDRFFAVGDLISVSGAINFLAN